MSFSFPVQSNLSPLFNEDREPAFQAPWEAKAFAIVQQLAATQQCSLSEWTDQLAAEIIAAESDETNNSSYYKCWVSACEKLLIGKGFLDSKSIENKIMELLIELETKHDH